MPVLHLAFINEGQVLYYASAQRSAGIPACSVRFRSDSFQFRLHVVYEQRRKDACAPSIRRLIGD
jgi:hypothetical protein